MYFPVRHGLAWLEYSWHIFPGNGVGTVVLDGTSALCQTFVQQLVEVDGNADTGACRRIDIQVCFAGNGL